MEVVIKYGMRSHVTSLFYDKASFAPVYNKCYTKYVLLKLLILGDEKIGTEGETA